MQYFGNLAVSPKKTYINISLRSTITLQCDLSGLNDEQRKAVEHINGPTLVLAGAGSGKTRALTQKIAYLVSKGMKPWRILSVTFTNKAAKEMAGRVEKLLEMKVDGLWIGTFHGICCRILRYEAETWGFKRDFTIFDRDDQLATVRKAMREMGVDKKVINPNAVLSTISKAKNDFLSPEGLSVSLTGPNAKLLIKLYEKYNAFLRAAGAFDFDDLLLKPVEKFREDPITLEKWRNKFDHILVDEYQDTNKTQYLLMKMLGEGHGNITVVGDDDQSIYSWRGADIENILGFENDYDKALTVRLEQNYRSTKTILNAANVVVAKNSKRKIKTLWTDGKEGDKIKIFECWTDRDEAEKIVSTIQTERREHENSLNDFVILYRTNAQSRSFEDVLRRRTLPYVIVGGLRFYERKEIKDMISYLRIVANPDDPISFARAITTPKRSIGEKTISKIEDYARENGLSIIDALGRADEYIASLSLREKLKAFHKIIASAAAMRGEKPIQEIAGTLIGAIAYNSYLEIEFPENSEERIGNVDELLTAMGDFENHTDSDDLSAFLAEIALMSDIDTLDENSETITLMTLHSAKGLEFPSVFLSGVEKGLFPLPSSFENNKDLEEERRLFYVGMTRAEERLHISYAVNRARYGSFTGGASMFIDEVPDETIEFTSADYREAGNDRPRKVQPERKYIPKPKTPVRRPMEFEDYSQEIPDDSDNPYKKGATVRHPKFGRGVVMASSGSGDKTVLSIKFGTVMKKIMPEYVKLS